jgi:simple sugar transport system substrate-binding protein
VGWSRLGAEHALTRRNVIGNNRGASGEERRARLDESRRERDGGSPSSRMGLVRFSWFQRCSSRDHGSGPAKRRREPGVTEGESVDRRDDGAVDEVIERLEFGDRKKGDDLRKENKRWLNMTRRTALTGGAAGLATFILQACGGGDDDDGSTTDANAQDTSGGSGIFGKQPEYKFTLVNHVTTNPFFVPTKYGAEDACKLLGCQYQWTGSESANVREMVNAMNSAVSAKVDGIAVCLVDLKAFNGPTQQALDAGIPVLGYNADAAGNARLAYIGQDLYVSGQEMGKRIVDLVPSGDVALFIATPGALNIQPRIDGAIASIKQSGKDITHHVIATGAALPRELSTVDAYWQGHQNTKGMFAVDAGSTQAVAQIINKYKLRDKEVKGGGYDLLPTIQKLLAAGQIDFTIDQQPYLQGFLPVLELFLIKASQTLTGAADVNTGLKFLDKETVVPYNSTKSRYEGNAEAAGVTKA